jgi:hypothetical protein
MGENENYFFKYFLLNVVCVWEVVEVIEGTPEKLFEAVKRGREKELGTV